MAGQVVRFRKDVVAPWLSDLLMGLDWLGWIPLAERYATYKDTVMGTVLGAWVKVDEVDVLQIIFLVGGLGWKRRPLS